MLTDGTNTSCVGDCPQWKGIGYRYLAGLFKQEPRAEYRTVVEGCAQGAWTLARTASTGYFANDWRGPPTSSASVEGQARRRRRSICMRRCAALTEGTDAGLVEYFFARMFVSMRGKPAW